MTRLAAAIDLGGTKIAGALVHSDGTLRATVTVPTPRGPTGADRGGLATAEVLTDLLARADDERAAVCGAAIGLPEYVDPTGRITSDEVLDWDTVATGGLPPSIAAASAGTPLVVGSDVRFAALAECRVGAGEGADSVLYVTIGTGIAHCLVVHGEVWPGHRGEAIALGELTSTDRLRDDAPQTVEEQASGRALERVAAEFGVSPLDDTDARMNDARHLAGRVAAEAISTAVTLLDPQVVVLGGGLGTADTAYAESLADHFRSITSARSGAPLLRRSALLARSGVVGAGLAAHEHAGPR